MNKLQLETAHTKLSQALEAVMGADTIFQDDPSADPDMRANIFDAEDSVRRARASVLSELSKTL